MIFKFLEEASDMPIHGFNGGLAVRLFHGIKDGLMLLYNQVKATIARQGQRPLTIDLALYLLDHIPDSWIAGDLGE